MSYFKTHWIRLKREPWIFLVWAAYPFIITYILYLAFVQQGGLHIRVGVILPENLKTPIITDALNNRSYGPFTFVLFKNDLPWRRRKDLSSFSAVIEVPPLSLDELKNASSIEFTVWSNPREQIKPKIVKESLDLLLLLLNRGTHYFEPILDTLTRETTTLDTVLATSRQMYKRYLQYEPAFDSLGKIKIEEKTKRRLSQHEQGLRLYTSIFWLVFLPNIIFFVNSFQARFLRDMEKGMLYRWRGSPRGLLAAYRDIILLQTAFALSMMLAGYALARAFLHIRSAPFPSLIIVTFAMTLISIGLIQVGYRVAPSSQAAQAFIGISGMAVFFIGGGISVVLPSLMKNLAPHLPFYIAIKSLTGEPLSLTLLLAYAIAIFGFGTFLYRRYLLRAQP